MLTKEEKVAKIIEINDSTGLSPEEKLRAIDDFLDEQEKLEAEEGTKDNSEKVEKPSKPAAQKAAHFFEAIFEMLKGEQGDTPTDEELQELIKPLIPPPIPGDPGATPTKEELLELIRPLIPEVKNGETPSDERLLALITPLLPQIDPKQIAKDVLKEVKIPDPIPGKPGSPDSPLEIAGKLNTLTEALDIKVVKGLQKEVQGKFSEIMNQVGGKLRQIGTYTALRIYDEGNLIAGEGIREIYFSGSGVTVTRVGEGVALVSVSGGGGGGASVETPTGTVNGTNVTFTVANTPLYIVSDGATYFENNGYTLAGLTITMAVPPVGFIRSFY